MSCVETAVSDDKFADMEWGVSSAGTIQLINLLDPTLIYTNYHSPGTVGKIWRDHHHSLYQFISQDRYNKVLEIGGASGLLAENFCAGNTDFDWTIVEPSKHRSLGDDRVQFVEDFFESWNTEQKFDTLVHSHVFEHTYDPIKFLEKASSVLEPGGIQYISIPNMRYWLANGFTNTLSFEHTFYVDEIVLNYLLNKTGFKVVDQQINEHSIFIKAVKTQEVAAAETSFDYIRILFENYVAQQKKDVADILAQLNGRKFYLFGAHIFAQSLFNFGLNQQHVINLLDNDPNKQDKRLYGTTCWVKSPKVLEGLDNPIVVLRGGSYSQEIKESILKINPTTEFL